MESNKKSIGTLALIATTLIWASSFIILKKTLDTVPVMWVLALRFTGAAVILALFGFRQLKNIDRTCVRYGVGMGVVLAVAYIFQTFGLQYTTPGKNAFLTSTYCVLVPFMCWAIYKKRPDVYNISAAVVCVIGMGLVSLTGDMSLGIGDGLTMLCGIFYAIQIIITDRAVQSRSVLLVSMLEFAAAAAICWVGAAFSGPFPSGAPASAWWSIAYMCAMCTCVCFVLQAFGQRYTPPNTAAIILTLESVFGTVLSMIFYGERISARVAAGFVLIFAAVVVSETKLDFLKKGARSQASQIAE